MYECMYVYIYVYMYECMYVYIYVCMYVCMYICIYVCMYKLPPLSYHLVRPFDVVH